MKKGPGLTKKVAAKMLGVSVKLVSSAWHQARDDASTSSYSGVPLFRHTNVPPAQAEHSHGVLRWIGSKVLGIGDNKRRRD